jgi:hypothetical protein
MVTAKTKATVGMIVLTLAYVYYTVWILVTPLIDEKHYLQWFFPVSREAGLMFTTLLGYTQLSFFFTFVGVALVMTGKH